MATFHPPPNNTMLRRLPSLGLKRGTRLLQFQIKHPAIEPGDALSAMVREAGVRNASARIRRARTALPRPPRQKFILWAEDGEEMAPRAVSRRAVISRKKTQAVYCSLGSLQLLPQLGF